MKLLHICDGAAGGIFCGIFVFFPLVILLIILWFYFVFSKKMNPPVRPEFPGLAQPNNNKAAKGLEVFFKILFVLFVAYIAYMTIINLFYL